MAFSELSADGKLQFAAEYMGMAKAYFGPRELLLTPGGCGVQHIQYSRSNIFVDFTKNNDITPRRGNLYSCILHAIFLPFVNQYGRTGEDRGRKPPPDVLQAGAGFARAPHGQHTASTRPARSTASQLGTTLPDKAVALLRFGTTCHER